MQSTKFKDDDLRKTRSVSFNRLYFRSILMLFQHLMTLHRTNYQRNVLALAIRWVLDKGHTIALWGARHPAQLEDINDVMGWTLDAGAMRQIDRIIDQHIKVPVGPEFMAPPA